MTAMMGLTTQNCSVAWRADITIQGETKQTGKDTGGGEGGEEEEGGGRGVSAPNEMGHDSLLMAGVPASLFISWSGRLSTNNTRSFIFLSHLQQLYLKKLR